MFIFYLFLIIILLFNRNLLVLGFADERILICSVANNNKKKFLKIFSDYAYDYARLILTQLF